MKFFLYTKQTRQEARQHVLPQRATSQREKRRKNKNAFSNAIHPLIGPTPVPWSIRDPTYRPSFRPQSPHLATLPTRCSSSVGVLSELPLLLSLRNSTSVPF